MQSLSSKLLARVVELYTNEGVISVELYDDDAPRTAESFFRLACSGQLDGAVFSRMIPGFVLECSLDNVPLYGELFEPERNKKLHHTGAGILCCFHPRGDVSTEKKFFITLGPQPQLDDLCTIFGRVCSGMHVVEKISKFRVVNESFRLYTPVVLKRCVVRVLPKETRPYALNDLPVKNAPRLQQRADAKSSLLNNLE
ncbi:putative cyclophilin type peptidyl-prolyl cis-trans isomerase [Trypanosoma theileri]|uniref:Peptidyl-prolyl cis-trans isomerase n=1 Tax=Trypanosoma theileri TaxID=67003 RepID=A0A1X0NGT2_9TRYP|nr:putative cyclophilin type peptidyl-prolyl cis-trans isomerase [Trypanosoma theileri]ORC83728.1 putative cyclophilin type peptidyl-prolyl cis-trans isomerase [Trypanosoma theileri]